MAPLFGFPVASFFSTLRLTSFKTGLDLSGLSRTPKNVPRYTTSDTYNYDYDHQSDMSSGEIAGIVCGSVIALVLFVWLLWMCVALTSVSASRSYTREKKYRNRRSCYSSSERCSRGSKGRTICVEDCYSVRPADRVYPYYNGRYCYYDSCCKETCSRSCPATVA